LRSTAQDFFSYEIDHFVQVFQSGRRGFFVNLPNEHVDVIFMLDDEGFDIVVID